MQERNLRSGFTSTNSVPSVFYTMLKIVTYSDLHLEFGHGWNLPSEVAGDVLVLAGDIVSFENLTPLKPLLERWGTRPVIYVAGNHELYNAPTINAGINVFRQWLRSFPNVHFLQDEGITIEEVHFFGGTMWTDFAGGNPSAMVTAQGYMNDFKLIRTQDDVVFTPADSIELHRRFVDRLSGWFLSDLQGPRIVVSHHAPVLKPGSIHAGSALIPAFNSTDMLELIKQHQPDLWVYGHTHECDWQRVGKTTILSNQLGYQNGLGGFECLDFDRHGRLIEI